jgi:hypothetical protein
MIGTSKTVTVCIILMISLVGVFTVCMPTTSAGLLKFLNKAYTCNSEINIEYDSNAARDPFLPVDMVKEIPLTVNYRITGLFAEEIPFYYHGGEAFNFIYLYVEKTPDWCTASVEPSIIFALPRAEGTTKGAVLSVHVSKNAYALSEGTITIKAEIPKRMGSILGGVFYQNITFTPGYLPNLRINTPEGTIKFMGPGETTNFQIDIENLGNADTRLTCKVLDLPKGWTSSISSDSVIGSEVTGTNPKKTIQLDVQPPYGFGYHNDKEVIRVSITPSFFNNESLVGKEYSLSFIVQSKGFSTPGFETVFGLIALIAVVLLLKKRQRVRGTINKISKGRDDT